MGLQLTGNLKGDKALKIAENDLSYNAAKFSESTLMNKLEELNKAYKSLKDQRVAEYAAALPDSLGLTKKTFEAASDEELKSQAESALSADYEEDKNKLLNTIEDSRQVLNADRESLDINAKAKLDKLDKDYQEIKENLHTGSIKKGVARSSIASGVISVAETEKTETADAVTSAANTKIAEIDAEITSLEAEKEDSIKAFELAHAVEVQEKLDKLRAARDKEAASVTEYNNKVDEKETAYQADKQEQIADYSEKLNKSDLSEQEFYEENGYYPSMEDEYKDRYSMAYDFYMSLSADTAKRVLNENGSLEDYLGSKYYNQLKTAVGIRKG